ACIRIPIGKGVCGSAVKERKVLRIDDVHQFKGHIACDGASNSEIVLPIYKNDEVVAVLDIDSPFFNRFSSEDEKILSEITDYIGHLF
ncbi:GAF domain-containing protein, partial [uncultured Traorella sp.]|uniref:GAF domain-containing protein n=1 Tax=uncultured Traorella sp. TaxID=1929048 RepID=UPI0025F8FC9F